MKVYAAIWISCIYEGTWDVISIHKSKYWAFKALLKYRYNKWIEAREEYLLYGLKSDYSPTYQELGCIEEFNVKE